MSLARQRSNPVTTAEASIKPAPLLTLPIELLDYVLQSLTRTDLLVCLRVNSAFHTLTSRVLYRTIDELRPRESILCLLELDRNPRVSPLVRKLDLDWNIETTRPTRNLYQLLHRVLQKLTGLTSLSLELPRADGPCWILDACTFSLRAFSTSLPCDPFLARFLDSQPALTELTLRGLINHPGDSLPSMPPFLVYAPDPPFSSRIPNFKLAPTALPRLTSLRTVHGGPAIIAAVAKGRPVEMASIALFPLTSSESLKALSLSTAPMRRLSIMSFDPAVQEYLLSEIAGRFPQLEALHVVILLSEYTNDLLKALGPLLAGFKSLQYITFMAATDRTAQPGEEQAIAKLWHRWCPTLKTIILPRGRVWFEGRSEWSSLDPEDE
ncbi:hypothetical protein D9615_008238 [Tricholomella constricta]|uniref:F-box domain-containing protein n=1 Tax=Tricholomella constricta TaxID=117010 RepID=A0A8H5M015_9AGAR|nr:hypothetical protein D9615_008238 [Tricholomella constricta]